MDHWDIAKPIRVLKGDEETMERLKAHTTEPRQAIEQGDGMSIRRHIIVRLTARVEVTEEYYLSLFHNPDRVMKTVFPNYTRQLCSLDVLKESEPFKFTKTINEWKV